MSAGTSETGSGYGANVAAASRLLERFRREPLAHVIAGERVRGVSGATFVNRSPIDGQRLGEVAAGGAADVARAAGAAALAFAQWRETPAVERKKVLHRIADVIDERAHQIALVECADTGQTIRFMSSAAHRGAGNFRFFADRAPAAADGLFLPSDHHINYTTRHPIGPVAVITPWNTPFMLSTWKIAPALAAGCTVVHKPAEWSPLSAQLLSDAAADAGLPPGVLNVVHGRGETAGRALTEHPAVKAIAFVGESATGSAIQAQGAPTLKRLHFELGGKNPVIVFDDADLERALNAAVFMIYSLNGERCTSSSRLLVQSSIHDEFCDRLAQKLKAVPVGHPLDPDAVIGPLIHPTHVDRVRGYVKTATVEGCSVTEGTPFMGASGEPLASGNWFTPLLLTGATPGMQVAREEIFGPVLAAMAFSDESEAIRIANDTPYGLAAYVWTGDTGRAHRVAKALDVGMVWVNSHNVRHLPTPFGGTKASGIGRDGGDWSFDFYMETKNIAVSLDTHTIPELATRAGGVKR